MAGKPGKRECGDWCPELAALREDPERMLLAAVYLRAKWDARESREARGFLRRVEWSYRGVGDAGYALLMAMQSRRGRRPRPARGGGARAA